MLTITNPELSTKEKRRSVYDRISLVRKIERSLSLKLHYFKLLRLILYNSVYVDFNNRKKLGYTTHRNMKKTFDMLTHRRYPLRYY